MLPDVFRKPGFRARPRTHDGNLELTAVLTLLIYNRLINFLLMVAIHGHLILPGNLYFGAMLNSAIQNTIFHINN